MENEPILAIMFADEAKLHAFMFWLQDQGIADYYGWIRIVMPAHEVETFKFNFATKVINTTED